MELEVTSIKDLKKIAEGEVVELPGFSGTPFVARLRQASLVKLVSSGKIPNKLLGIATALFNSDTDRLNKELQKKEGIEGLHEIMSAMADACLIEPSMQDIKEAGLELSDIQLSAIFNYSQQGVNGLEMFRNR